MVQLHLLSSFLPPSLLPSLAAITPVFLLRCGVSAGQYRCQIECQKICQNRCKIECQIECQKYVR